MFNFIEYETSYITSDDLILLGRFAFSVVYLPTRKVLFEEKNPFGYKKRKISNIIYNENNKFIFLLSNKGDFVIYKMDCEKSSIVKQFVYIQKENVFNSGVSPLWIDDNFLYYFIEDESNNSILRKVSYSGNVTDLNFHSFVAKCSMNFFENDHFFSINKQKYMIDSTSNVFGENISCFDCLEKYNEENVISVFTDGTSSNLYSAFFENNNIKFSKLNGVDSKFTVFTKKYNDSYLHVKVHMDDFIIVEENICFKLLNYNLRINYKNTVKEFDFSNLFKKNVNIYLSSFNCRWISIFNGRSISVFELDKI